MPFWTLWLTGNALGFRAGHQPPPRGPKHCCVLAGTCWTRACVSCRASSSESLSAKPCSLFLPNYVQDKYLLQLLRSADDVSTWVAAEIVTSHTSKVGAQGSGPSTGSGVPAVRAPPWASPSAGGAQRRPKLKPLEQASTRGTQGRAPAVPRPPPPTDEAPRPTNMPRVPQSFPFQGGSSNFRGLLADRLTPPHLCQDVGTGSLSSPPSAPILDVLLSDSNLQLSAHPVRGVTRASKRFGGTWGDRCPGRRPERSPAPPGAARGGANVAVSGGCGGGCSRGGVTSAGTAWGGDKGEHALGGRADRA